MELKIKYMAQTKCDRCGETLISDCSNSFEPLVNRITGETLNHHGTVIADFSVLEKYICDDCWNKLIDFIINKKEMIE